jgi:hypothetical protein
MIAEVGQLIDGYMARERTIILAVIPANEDIERAEILQRARKADPDGLRTIGVLTKPDLCAPEPPPWPAAATRCALP